MNDQKYYEGLVKGLIMIISVLFFSYVFLAVMVTHELRKEWTNLDTWGIPFTMSLLFNLVMYVYFSLIKWILTFRIVKKQQAIDLDN